MKKLYICTVLFSIITGSGVVPPGTMGILYVETGTMGKYICGNRNHGYIYVETGTMGILYVETGTRFYRGSWKEVPANPLRLA